MSHIYLYKCTNYFSSLLEETCCFCPVCPSVWPSVTFCFGAIWWVPFHTELSDYIGWLFFLNRRTVLFFEASRFKVKVTVAWHAKALTWVPFYPQPYIILCFCVNIRSFYCLIPYILSPFIASAPSYNKVQGEEFVLNSQQPFRFLFWC